MRLYAAPIALVVLAVSAAVADSPRWLVVLRLLVLAASLVVSFRELRWGYRGRRK